MNILCLKKIENVNALIILPSQVGSVFQVWQKEIQKWANFDFIDFVLIEGTPDKRKKILVEKKSSITIISNNLVGWLADNTDFSRYNLLIVDESSEYKNHMTNRFKKLSKLITTQRRYILSGTPAPKSWQDIWSQIYLLDKGKRLSSNFYHFRNTYFYEFKEYRWAMKQGAKNEIIKAINDIACFSEGNLNLPAMHTIPIYLQFSPDKQKIFNEMKKNFVAEWEGNEVSALSTAIMINKCLQLSNGMCYLSDGSSVNFDDTKIKWLEDFAKKKKIILLYFIFINLIKPEL